MMGLTAPKAFWWQWPCSRMGCVVVFSLVLSASSLPAAAHSEEDSDSESDSELYTASLFP